VIVEINLLDADLEEAMMMAKESLKLPTKMEEVVHPAQLVSIMNTCLKILKAML